MDQIQIVLMALGLVSGIATGLHIMFAALAAVFPTVTAFATLSDLTGRIGVAVASFLGKGSARGFVSARVMYLVAVVTLVFSVACGIVQSVAPTAIPFAACVAQDAIAKKTLAQMVTDCGGDFLAVLEALLSSADPAVQQSAAYAEAARIQVAMTHLPRASR